ncbi:hypothetical protein BAE44_0001283 [Dichanthelium oligosanthes]|uniref:Uncharacterized protein n=1 Tax=Dichanthelium oligosanthes TaxID=888268 RepID=A0A1E5WJY3_9POAL|nr:hypothetical protein BAE44_0001283 [Dichanthelium oligosanthes]
MSTEDEQPPLIPQYSANDEDETPQRGELEEESGNERSSSGDFCGQDPNNSRYNLCGRGVDEATQLRREEHKRMRLKHIERKRLRREQQRREGDKKLFSCSGPIVEFLNDTGYVVTSASLIRCPDKDEQADELKVEESSAEHSEIQVGDIITHVDSLPFSSAAELGGILLDMCGKLMLDRQKLNLSDDFNQTAPVMCLKFRVRTFGEGMPEITTATVNVGKFTPGGGQYRWPLPRPIIVRQCAYGKVVDEEWCIASRDA